MSDDWNSDDDLDLNDNSGGGLRKQLEAIQKKLKSAEERAAKAEQSIAVTTVSASLKEKGYKESAAKWAQRDGVDISDAKALDKWLEADGAEFKIPDSEADPNNVDDEPNPVAPEGATEVASAVTNLRSVATPPSAVALERALKALAEDADEDTVYKTLASAGL